MNEKVILGMVEPYVKNGNITYEEFDNIFNMLPLKEQYKVLDVLEKHNIELIDEEQSGENKDEEELIENLDFEVLYDAEIFSDQYSENPDESAKLTDDENADAGLIVREHISISNRTLIRLIQEGNIQAKQDLCIKNRGLVDKMVYSYMKMAGNKLEFEDLETVGMMGMLKAAEKFDLSSDYEFSTYATWWIKQSITREIMDNGFTVRIPVHKMEVILRVMKYDAKFAEETDYKKRIAKISDGSGYDEETVLECLELYHQFLRAVSLDVPVGEDEDVTLGEDEDVTLGDFILDDEKESVEDSAMMTTLRENLEKVIATLKPREQTVIKLRFGFEDGQERTLEEIGQLFGVTRERIRQIEVKALRKLRHPSRLKKLQDYDE